MDKEPIHQPKRRSGHRGFYTYVHDMVLGILGNNITEMRSFYIDKLPLLLLIKARAGLQVKYQKIK